MFSVTLIKFTNIILIRAGHICYLKMIKNSFFNGKYNPSKFKYLKMINKLFFNGKYNPSKLLLMIFLKLLDLFNQIFFMILVIS